MRVSFWSLFVLLGACPAFAECRNDALAARGRIEMSGPYRYEREVWNENFRRRECGAVDPGRAEHEYPCASETGRQAERIVIGRDVWKNDRLGWLLSRTILPSVSNTSSDEDISCLGTVTEGERTLERYRFTTEGTRRSTETLFVDSSSGLPVRRERGGSINSISTYTYDLSIRIEAPVVDLEKRRLNAIAHLEAAVSTSDPVCRANFLDAVERGRKIPFRFSIQTFTTHDGGTNGVFTPPFSFVVRQYIIGDAIPERTSSYTAEDPWAEAGYDEAKVYRDLKFFRYALMPLPNEVGATHCLGRVSYEGQAYDAIEYDSYAERKIAYGEEKTEKQLLGTQRMLIDPDKRVPIRVQVRRSWWHGPSPQEFVDVQKRNYEPPTP
ncbi:hypothetical protein [Microvirga terricola]|uniref:Uncharacterized protein n=1 Tax=Microvirga terricola TaxID=2719797 RepID=A0ABX0VB28_9HYPH|nr:hypothetical protein [Microvirga terricola]NIX75601.1 hypothetical protein [Microvirga terricola]